MQRDGFLGGERRVCKQVQRFDELVALQRMLAAKTIGIGTFLNLLALKRRGGNSASGNHFALVNARANAGGKPGIDLAKLHARFRERHAFYAAHFGVGSEQQCDLRFQRNLEGVFAEGTLPTVHVGFFRSHHDFAALRQGRGFGDRNSLRGAGRDAIARQTIGGGEAPSAVREHANAEADRFALRQRADLTVLGGEVALA